MLKLCEAVCRAHTDASQKKFTCESTGHTGFTFFEAKESEVRSTPVLEKGSLIVTTPQSESSKEINSILPEALRSRVLEYVQFQSTARMDDLGKHPASLGSNYANGEQSTMFSMYVTL